MNFKQLCFVILFAGIGVTFGFASQTQEKPAKITTPEKSDLNLPKQLNAKQYAEKLITIPKASELRRWHDLLTQEPHVAGTPGDLRQIERLKQAFNSMGLEARVEPFRAYLARPISATLEIIDGAAKQESAPVENKNQTTTAAPPTRKGVLSLPVNEKNLLEDPATAHPDLTYGWNAYSGNGDVTAEVVYANYATQEDFELLKSLGVDVTGKIVLARYGKNFRGYKARFAEEAGAAGLIIFTDPADSGFAKGATWPSGGGWANDLCIQRGTLNTLPYPGDPGTPGVYAADNVLRDAPDRLDLPRIPVQPVGYAAAGAILSRMKGINVPDDSWQGGLNFPYRLTGGSDLKVRLAIEQQRFLGVSANVMAMVQGWRRPDEIIVVGCHHDAWGYGAADPCAGTICLLEAANCVSELIKQGIRPERTIIFAAWGAEEFGIIGSTEWVESHEAELGSKIVAYVNLDMAAMGPNLSIALTPELTQVAKDAAALVPAARNSSETSLAVMLKNQNSNSIFGALGGGSDHVGFVCRMVVPAIAISAGGSQGTSYHSNYDTTAWYRATVGEDYEPALMVTRATLSFMALMSNQKIPPYQFSEIGRLGLNSLDELSQLAKTNEERSAVELLRPLLMTLQSQGEIIDHQLAQNQSLDARGDFRVTDGIRKFLKAFQDHDGLHERFWYKNIWIAPDPLNSYSASTFPMIREALRAHEHIQLNNAVIRLTNAIQRASKAAELILVGLQGTNAIMQ
ncbi:MAG: M20/M25/M40 family metallo-hydrolase [Phycisphaerales bacterium]|nr:M20/M25/M40 family metallo-hydrolase [Phycisphaerales bacterium]